MPGGCVAEDKLLQPPDISVESGSSASPPWLSLFLTVYRHARMSAWWSILRNSGIVLAGNSVAKLLVLAATVIIGRALGPEQFGWYSLVLTYVMFVAILPELGMDAIVTREMARQPQLAAQLLGAAVSLRLIMILIVTV